MNIDGKERGLVAPDYLGQKYETMPNLPEPQEGDLRIIEETKPWPHRFRVDWYGTLTAPRDFATVKKGTVTTGWRTAEAYGEAGYFPTCEAAQEAIDGPKVRVYYRRTK